MVDKTLIILKPEVLKRGVAGRVISRFEDRGIQIDQMKLIWIDRQTAELHYAEHSEKSFFSGLVDYITSGPVVVAVLAGNDIVSVVRKMVGPTNPAQADPGTIRGDFATSVAENVIHASDSVDSAGREIRLFFGA